MATGLGEFFIQITVDSIKGELSIQGLVAQMGELSTASIGEITILKALADRLEEIGRMSLNAALGFKNFEETTGESADGLQKWQAGVKYLGGDAATATEAISKLNEEIAGGHTSEGFGALKNLSAVFKSLNLTDFLDKPGTAILEYIRKDANNEFQHLAPRLQKHYLDQAGLGSMMQVLSKRDLSDKEFARAIRDYGSMKQGDIDDWSEAGKDMRLIMGNAGRIERVIASWFSAEFLRGLGATIMGMEKIANYMDKLHGVDVGGFLHRGASLSLQTVGNPLLLSEQGVRAGWALGARELGPLPAPLVPVKDFKLTSLDEVGKPLVVNDYSQTTITGDGLWGDKQLNQAAELFENKKKKVYAAAAKHLHTGTTE